MYFNATPANFTELLVVCVAIISIIMLLKKRYDSNLPMLFYFLAVIYTNVTDRQVNPAILYGGLAFALLLRFEFMGSGTSKFVAFLANAGLVLMIYVMMSDALA
jgi:hypothetical protein